MIYTAAFNINPDGTFVLDGDHSPGTSGIPWESLGIESRRISVGSYLITGNNIKWPSGWRATIYRDENGDNTVFLRLNQDESGLTVETFDRHDKSTPTDIIYMLTLRVACEY